MTRVAIYARYSSELQSEASIEDQIRLCEERARKDGYTVVNHYTDHGLSGASMMRPGVQMLMQHAAERKFDLIIAESIDRLSRDQEDIAGIYKRLSFAGVKLFTLSEGEINELHIGLKGTMGALYLKDLADKTRRGLRGRVEAGKSGGGNSYGYKVVTALDPAGNPLRGDREISKEEAEIVNRIFAEYAAGDSPKVIAKRLNAASVPGPSGKGWGPTTINGNRHRGTGILNNELYIGRMVWNRLRYVKDPETGKRVSRPNPESEWITKDVSELRIVPQELWDKVKERQGELDRTQSAFWTKQRPRSLFASVLKCGCCEGGYSKINKDRYGCFNAYNKGTCENKITMRQDRMEQLVFDILRNHLMDPELCKEFCDEYTRHKNQLYREHNAALHRVRAEMKKLESERDRILDAVVAGFANDELRVRLDNNVARRKDLQAVLDGAEEAPTLIHPRMADRYREEVTGLIAAFNDPEHRAEAAELIRALIDKIVLTPNEENDDLTIDLIGDLAGILWMATQEDDRPSRSGGPQLQSLESVKMVAGARNHLTLLFTRTMSLPPSDGRCTASQNCTPRVNAPSTTKLVPMMKLAAGLARNATARAISSGFAILPVGFNASACLKKSGLPVSICCHTPPSK
jgi:DNA invertase Pin-like site-specific DNA recombinase